MTCAIAVMAKAPRPGKVNTCLSPPLPVRELPPWHDVDDRAALQRLARELDVDGPRHATTAALVAALRVRDRLAE